MFKDKVYEELDDISKLVEPFQSGINEELALFPDEIEITNDMILNLHSKDWGWSTFRVGDIISEKAKELNLKTIEREYHEISREFFEIKVENLEEGEEVTINFETGIMSHRLLIVKAKIGYDDNELEKQARYKIINTLRRNLSSNKVVNKSRINEISDLYGAYDVRKDRTYRGKVRKLCKHLEELMDDRKLDIKDLGLCERFANWIILYVRDGNLPALNNVTRIKIMMHEDRPIYSIEERDVK